MCVTWTPRGKSLVHSRHKLCSKDSQAKKPGSRNVFLLSLRPGEINPSKAGIGLGRSPSFHDSYFADLVWWKHRSSAGGMIRLETLIELRFLNSRQQNLSQQYPPLLLVAVHPPSGAEARRPVHGRRGLPYMYIQYICIYTYIPICVLISLSLSLSLSLYIYIYIYIHIS